VTADGRSVAFQSAASDLVNGDGNGTFDIFVRDTVAGTTQRVSLDTADGDPNGPSRFPAISADGKFVAFISSASDLVLGDNNGRDDVFLRNLVGGSTIRITAGQFDNDPTRLVNSVSLSGDGKRVAYDVSTGSQTNPDFHAYLRANPVGLAGTTDLFRDLDRASAEAMRQTWRHKFEVGFWRPVAAITSNDGDPLTDPVAGWTSVLPLPPYPDWPSGHGTLTSAFAETVRCHLGDIPLTLNGAGDPRTYTSLEAMEHDAFMSRIWGGIHFRDAMDDGYRIGHTVARQTCG